MMAARPRPVWTTRRGSRPLRLALALGAAIAVALPSSVAAAGPPVVVHEDVDVSFQLQGLTAVCGYPVFTSIVGRVQIVVHYDADGHPVREIDSGMPTRTIYAPSTEKSVSFPFSLNSVATYAPDGSAIVTFSGMFIDVHSAGGAPHLIDSGREVWSAVIIDIRPDGVPVWELIDLLQKSGSDRGNFADICLSLNP
jgi:hypothetical protein